MRTVFKIGQFWYGLYDLVGQLNEALPKEILALSVLHARKKVYVLFYERERAVCVSISL